MVEILQATRNRGNEILTAVTILLTLLAVVVFSTVATYGATLTATDEDGETTLTLIAEDTLTLNPPTANWCAVEIEIFGSEVVFTEGDQVQIWIYEDDVAADDLVFETVFTVTAGEISAQYVYRYIECDIDPANVLDGLGDYSELYAEARVYKDACGFLCVDDHPQTPALDILVLQSVSDVPDIPTTHLGDAYPNPFNPQSNIAFELASRCDVDLRVFDLSGRLVRTLIAGEIRESGSHTAIWNGRDDAGRHQASGAYFYRLAAGQFFETKRMTLVR